MLKLKNLLLPKKLAAVVPLREVINQSIHFRCASLMDMGGYPVSAHVVGKIQASIDLTSYKDLLESFVRLRKIARLAGDALDIIPLARIDRAQMNRSELITFIAANASNFGAVGLTPDDFEFAAYLISSSESVETSWMLTFTDDKTNRFKMISELYKSGLKGTVIRANKAGIELEMVDNALGFIYDPADDKVTHFMQMKSSVITAAAWASETDPIRKAAFETELNQSLVVHLAASVRIIDHAALLINSVSAWSAFLNIRKNSIDTAGNTERTRTLHLFAGYLQSLLIYPHIFALEMIKQSYDTVQSVYLQFPPLPGSLIAKYDQGVHTYDTLNAREDVTSILNVWSSKHESEGGTIVPLLEEVTMIMGSHAAYTKAIAAVAAGVTPIKLLSLEVLSDPDYNPYMLSHPVAEVDLFTSITRTLYVGDVMKKVIIDSVSQIIYATPLYLNDEIIDAIKRAGFKVPFNWCQTLALTGSVTKTSSPRMEGGSLKYHTLLPRHTYDYRFQMRRKTLNKIFKQSEYTNNGSNFLPQMGINYTHANRLRNISELSWRSLYPTFMVPGDYVYTPELVLSNVEQKRRLMEAISQSQYELIIRTISNPQSQKMWSTFLSSFACLYVTAAQIGYDAKGAVTASSLAGGQLVEGYGRPYGVTYNNLASKQKAPLPADILTIGANAFIKFHDKVPMPSLDIDCADDFYLAHPYYFFKANGNWIDVKEWVMDEGLLHMSLFKLAPAYNAPQILLDRRYAYLNDELYAQLNLLYTLPEDADSEASISYPASAVVWRHDRLTHWLQYIAVGSYGPSEIQAAGESTAITTMIEKAEQSLKEVEINNPANAVQKPAANPVTHIGVADLSKEKSDAKSTRAINEGNTHKKGGAGSKHNPKDKEADKGDAKIETKIDVETLSDPEADKELKDKYKKK